MLRRRSGGHERDPSATASSWAGYAGCAWALVYVPIHVYWALTGSLGPFGELPANLDPSQWQQANWGASIVIIGAAVFSLALVRPWGRRLPRRILLGMAWLGAAFAVLHWVAFSTGTVLNMTGVTDGAVVTFDRWNLFVFEPWFLGMGILLAVAAMQYSRREQEAAIPGAARPQSSIGLGFVALIVGGSLVVLAGVMTFDARAYAVAGPGLIALGLLGSLATRRHRLRNSP